MWCSSFLCVLTVMEGVFKKVTSSFFSFLFFLSGKAGDCVWYTSHVSVSQTCTRLLMLMAATNRKKKNTKKKNPEKRRRKSTE